MSSLVDCPHCATRVLPMAGRVCPACRRNVDAPPAPRPEAGRAAEETDRIAAQQVTHGLAPPAVEALLKERGLDAGDAATVVDRLEQTRAMAMRHAARRNMACGAAWCVVGIAVTALTYHGAATAGGGKFVVAWGAIVFGGLQFIRGLAQLAESSPAR